MMLGSGEGRPVVARTFPLYAVGFLGGLVVSMLAGFLLASWAIAGITPAYAVPPAVSSSNVPGVASMDSSLAAPDSWREAGYARIGLWEEPSDLHADGSSRL